ncbi:ComEC/Rec2 family competence protein [Bacillus sp. FJAT-45350]|uniref:ComEC/Rec2 family competence protein n=1 Tax=Bacillus sp. FJAT-45350 TaxID=2011014 RepID=UPI000BB76478|nr:hypothetical protein [Bacillus sp. FJAT-45350]
MRMILSGFVCIFSMLIMFGCAYEPVAKNVGDVDKVEVDLNLTDEEVAFTYFDITNGEATLIQSGKGGAILIGTGEKSSEQELARRLDIYDVQEIDALVLVNNKQEYIGNVSWLLSNYSVNKIIVPKGLEEDLKSKFQVNGDIIEGWDVGVQRELLPNLVTEVYYAGEEGNSEQAFVISFTYGKQRTLYMGVANEAVERQLAEQYSLKSAILKVADFGSPFGTSQEFLKEVDPQIAILFHKMGVRPSETVLERLQETWIDIYQTSKNGSISIKCTSENYQILTVHTEEEEEIIAPISKKGWW